MSYDPQNIFAKILRGEIPSHKIYEDGDALAIMDAFPQVPGHCLVIPKAASRSLLDASDDSLAKLLPLVKKLAKATQEALGKTGVQIRQYNEAAAGQTVFHLHIHILPVDEGQVIGSHAGKMADQDELARQAEAIKARLASKPSSKSV